MNNFKTVDAYDQEAKKKRPGLNRVNTSIVKKIKMFLVTALNFYAIELCLCCANRSNIVGLGLGYASAITEQKKCWKLLAEKFDRFQTLRNNTQQHPTTCNRVCKRTQHVTSSNVGSCWSTMLRPFVRSLATVSENKDNHFDKICISNLQATGDFY